MFEKKNKMYGCTAVYIFFKGVTDKKKNRNKFNYV